MRSKNDEIQWLLRNTVMRTFSGQIDFMLTFGLKRSFQEPLEELKWRVGLIIYTGFLEREHEEDYK